jgi:hypothetical protein
LILAKLRHPASGLGAVSRTLRDNGLEVAHEVQSVPGLKFLRVAGAGATGGKGLEKRIKALQSTGLFEYVEPDRKYSANDALPTDTAFVNGDLWGLSNTGQDGGTAGIDVNAVAAWAITTGAQAVTVGVIDTGVRYTHQDLSANMWTNTGEIPNNGLDDDHNGYLDDRHGINALNGSGDPMDDNNHGTHVSGTIAATAFNPGQHVGVAFDVRIMALKFLDSSGNGEASGAIECIDYAIANGVDILNASWGGPDWSQALKDAIQAAGEAGILFIAGAGNNGANTDTTPFYPASFDLENVVSVAAIDRTGSLAWFSNRGSTTVDLAAPGVSILSCNAQSDSSYGSSSGTSMATPHVAGVAALVASLHTGADVAEQKARLLQSAVPLASLAGSTVTGGMVDAAGALQIAEDGTMEFQAATPRGALLAGESNTITIRVSDFLPVTGATVSAYLGGGSPTAFLDDGIAPDAVANDAVYTAGIVVPEGASTINLNISATAAGKLPSSDVATFNIVSEFSNDNFADRIVLEPGTTSTSGSNIGASWETGEPYIPGLPGLDSVWWEWIAPSAELASIDTIGSNFDTALAVYRGESLGSLVYVTGNDDISFPENSQSGVSFTPVPGESYKIQVYGSFFETGDIVLNYPSPGDPNSTPPRPVNDDFITRIRLPLGTSETTGTNSGATTELGEPLQPDGSGTSSVWWEWVAATDEPATITTGGSDFDTTLAVYSGTGFVDMVLVSEDNDALGLQSSVTFDPVAGSIYLVQVNGNGPETGSITLTYPPPGLPIPPNDMFANRSLLAPGTIRASGTNENATTETGEALNPPGAGGQTVWWEWIAAQSGPTSIDTIDSTFDTTLAIYTGPELASLSLVGANDNFINAASAVSFDAVAGQSYYIQVDGAGGDSGQVFLNYPMPFPVSVSPGRCRVKGSPGGSSTASLTLANGDSLPVNFSVTAADEWIDPFPTSGLLPTGIPVVVTLALDPLPPFSSAVYSSVTLTFDHPGLPSVEIPIEVIDESLAVVIPDPNLRRAVEQHLGRLPGEPIADIEMQILTSLDATARDISSLQGLQHAGNLFYLFLANNRISDLSPLAGLSALSILDLYGNNLSDISLLPSLPILLNLDVRYNYLDINPGSDDRAIIDSLGVFADVQFDPQKPGLLSLAEWVAASGIPAGQDGPDDRNGPLALANILAFMMGLDPYDAGAAELPFAYHLPGTNLYSFTYYRDLKATGITVQILNSTDLNAWEPSVPSGVNVLWDDGNGHQLVEAIFENPSDRLFFMLDVNPY